MDTSEIRGEDRSSNMEQKQHGNGSAGKGNEKIGRADENTGKADGSSGRAEDSVTKRTDLGVDKAHTRINNE